MTSDQFIHSLRSVAFFSALSYLVSSSAQLIDMVWVTRLGPAAPTAVAIAAAFFFVVLSVNEAIGVGSLAMLSQAVGAGKKHHAGVLIVQTLLLKLAMGCAMAVGFCLLIAGGAHWFSADASVLLHLRDYAKVIWLSLIIIPVSATLMTALRVLQEERATTMLAVIQLAGNATLTPLLIFGAGPFDGLGIAGAAWATVASQLLSLILAWRILLRNRAAVALCLPTLLWDTTLYRRMFYTGLPIALVMMLINLEAGILTALASRQGVAMSDGFALALRFTSILKLLSWGLSTGVGLAVGKAIGAGATAVVRRKMPLVVAGCSTILALTAALLITLGQWLLGLFLHNPDSVQAGIDYLRILGVASVFYCIQAVLSGVFEGAGRNLPVLFASITVFMLVEFPLLLWVGHITPNAIATIGIVVIASNALLALCLWVAYQRNHWLEPTGR